MQISQLVLAQRDFFLSGATLDLSFRKEQLKKLAQAVKEHENEILAALKSDMGKPETEAYMGEVGFLYDEIRHTLRHLEKWAKPVRVSTPLLQFPARSEIHFEPVGVTLIIGPWNYPFQLVVAPLVAALAAGNCAVLKPSELAPHTSHVLAVMIRGVFDPKIIAVVEGGQEVSTELLAQRFDHIFFTGGATVGRVVLEAAAKFLTPVTLELGGKSPCLVDEQMDLEVTARRIVWGKFFNAGQTCVAPDYLMVPEKLKAPLIEKMQGELQKFFGPQFDQSPDYARIINDRHFSRLEGLLGEGRAVVGGTGDRAARYFPPTIVDEVNWGSKVMQDEIFGPILPVLTYQTLTEAIRQIKSRPKPLALYLFSSNSATQERVLKEVSFGGGCINDTLIHLANPALPFGGVGDSGMGAYHGRFGFETFSHKKSLVRRGFHLDFSLRYPPYRLPLNRLRLLMRPPA